MSPTAAEAVEKLARMAIAAAEEATDGTPPRAPFIDGRVSALLLVLSDATGLREADPSWQPPAACAAARCSMRRYRKRIAMLRRNRPSTPMREFSGTGFGRACKYNAQEATARQRARDHVTTVVFDALYALLSPNVCVKTLSASCLLACMQGLLRACHVEACDRLALFSSLYRLLGAMADNLKLAQWLGPDTAMLLSDAVACAMAGHTEADTDSVDDADADGDQDDNDGESAQREAGDTVDARVRRSSVGLPL